MASSAVGVINGYLGGDPKVNQTQGDNPKNYVTFSIATNVKEKNGDKTSWWSCTSFNPRDVDFVSKYLTKGRQVSVVGELVIDSYENKKDGKMTPIGRVKVLSVTALDAKGSSDSSNNQQSNNQQPNNFNKQQSNNNQQSNNRSNSNNGFGGGGFGNSSFDDDIPF